VKLWYLFIFRYFLLLFALSTFGQNRAYFLISPSAKYMVLVPLPENMFQGMERGQQVLGRLPKGRGERKSSEDRGAETKVVRIPTKVVRIPNET
jgi:hypothetical protein